MLVNLSSKYHPHLGDLKVFINGQKSSPSVSFFPQKVDFGLPSSREMIYFWKFVNHSRHLKTPFQSLLVAGTQEEELCVEWTSGGKG